MNPTQITELAELKTALLDSLSETFQGKTGEHWFEGLFPSLEPLNAVQVSQSVHGNSIAAHLEHVCYTLEIGLLWLQAEKPSPDWVQSWTHQTVDDAAWQALQTRLGQQFSALTQWLEGCDLTNRKITLLCDLNAHTAYHVGAIRQMLKAVHTQV